MGWGSTSTLPSKTVKSHVEELIETLGYKKEYSRGRKYWYFFDERDNTNISYISAYIYKNDKNEIEVHLRANIWCSRSDIDRMNQTIRFLRRHFGGKFVTDSGTNTYFKSNKPYLSPDEAGCDAAYGAFDANISRLMVSVRFLNEPLENVVPPLMPYEWANSLNPRVLIPNMALPFLVASLEEYFRATYVSLLSTSHKKESIFNGVRPQGAELYKVSTGEMSIEQAIAKWMNFQDLDKVSKHFKALKKDYDISGWLRGVRYEENTSAYDTMCSIIDIRHQIIHNAGLFMDYVPDFALNHLEIAQNGIEKVYSKICQINGWQKSPAPSEEGYDIFSGHT